MKWREKGHQQAGILRTEIVAKRMSQTSPSEEQTSLFEMERRSVPCQTLLCDMHFATISVLKISAWSSASTTRREMSWAHYVKHPVEP